jgi:hypothetical protein
MCMSSLVSRLLPAKKLKSSPFAQWLRTLLLSHSPHLLAQHRPVKEMLKFRLPLSHLPSTPQQTVIWLLALVTPQKQLLRYSQDTEKNLMANSSDLYSSFVPVDLTAAKHRAACPCLELATNHAYFFNSF